MNKRKLGKEQEEIAVAYLKEHGYHIVEKNFWCRSGEIDIIAKEGVYRVFIEVKYRKSTKQGYPEEAVSTNKIHSITQAARFYMLKKGISEDEPCRFDVVCLLNKEVRIIKNAFEPYPNM